MLFVIAIVTDEELRAEMKDIRTVSSAIIIMIALYFAIMWIANEWVIWCL